MIVDAIYEHLTFGKDLEGEQKGCIRDRMGTKDQIFEMKWYQNSRPLLFIFYSFEGADAQVIYNQIIW